MAISNVSSPAALLSRYRFIAVGGETSFTGADSNSTILSYTPGVELVYLNGVLLVRDQDYTATTGTSITNLAALSALDVLEVYSYTPFSVANFDNLTLNSSVQISPLIIGPEERWTVSATAATGTINVDGNTQGVLYYTTASTGNWTLNVRGGSSVPLDTKLNTGDSFTFTFMATNGTTAYYQTGFTVDGVSQTIKWSGGVAPSSGNASSVDAYQFSIVKTASNTFTVFGVGPVKYA